MHRTLQHLILACQLLVAGYASAQTPAVTPTPAPAPATPAAAPEPAAAQSKAPLRSIAVLVDVSGSVDARYADEARGIIADLVSGRGFRPDKGWVSNADVIEPGDKDGVDAWPDDPQLISVFKNYLGSQPPSALTDKGKVFYLGSIGTVKTTLAPPNIRYINGIEEFNQLLVDLYPRRFGDGKTCYYMGVARTAQELLKQGGCYLFVVSDEWDDPGTDREAGEWLPPLKEAGYNKFYPKDMVNYFHELKKDNRFHLIARFHKGDRPKRNSVNKQYLRVTWYSIGEKPQSVEPLPPPPERKVGDPPPPPPPVVPVPPVFERTLTLLGGLTPVTDGSESVPPDASRIKDFDNPNPFLTWQVDGVTTVDSLFEVTVHRWVEDGQRLESVHKLFPAQLARTTEGRLRGLPMGVATPSLTNGKYRVTVKEKTATESAAGSAPGGLGPIYTWIEVKTPFNWVPWLLGISVLGAAGVIGYSVWTLRR